MDFLKHLEEYLQSGKVGPHVLDNNGSNVTTRQGNAKNVDFVDGGRKAWTFSLGGR